MAITKTLLFSVTLKDCRVDTFRSGGKGGQNQDKRDTGVRIVHEASGAVGESREERSQLQNKKRAFVKMAESQTFRTWTKVEVARRTHTQHVTRDSVHMVFDVKGLFPESDFLVEYREGGRWVPADGR